MYEITTRLYNSPPIPVNIFNTSNACNVPITPGTIMDT